MKTLVLCSLLIFGINLGFTQSWEQKVKLEATDQDSDDNLAIAVAKSGDYMIAGAWHEDHDGTGGEPLSNAGSAYIYRYNSGTDEWTQEAKLVAADREIDDWFGISVDISGTYAVVGAVQENANRGAAYVYERDGGGTWVQVAKLEAPVRKANDRFGNSVSISDETIIVGAFHEDEDENEGANMQNAGSAYIYTRAGGTWGFFQKIVASDRDTNDYFGYSVAVWDDKMIVGAYHRDIPTLSEYGGAYAFAYNGVEWEQTRILEGIDPYLGDRFGWSVDVYENYYIVGAPYHDYDDAGSDPKNNAGAAYIFDANNSWAQDKVVGGDRTAQDNVGEDVAIHGNRAIAGAPLQDYGLNGDPPYWGNGGAIFVYEVDGSGFWNQTQKLLTADRFTSDKFGHSIDLDASSIVGGAPEDNNGSLPSTGALYLFEDGVLGVNDINSASQMVAYPNPTQGALQIDMGSNYTAGSIVLFNMLGQKLLSSEFSNTRHVDLDLDIPTGIYMINIETSTGVRGTIRISKR